MILLKELKLNNFLSHEKTAISFGKNDKFLLDGKSGSGKSSITDAVLFAFYGKGRTDGRSLVRRRQKSATVSLKLDDGSTETLITRTVSSTGKNTLVVTQNTGTQGQFLPIGRTGLKDTQEWIESVLLKASYELFTNSIAYPQENENSFVKASASRRKDLLLEIVQANNFDELCDKAKKAITDNETNNAVMLSKYEILESTIKSSKELADNFDSYKEKLKDIITEVSYFSDREKSLEKDGENLKSIIKLIEGKKTLERMFSLSLSKIYEQLAKDDFTKKKYSGLDIEKAKKDVIKIEEMEKEIDKLQEEIKKNVESQMKINAHLANKPNVTDYTKDIENLNKRLIPLIKDMGKCPAGDKCPFTIPIKGQIEFLGQQIEEKSTKSVFEQASLERWLKEYALLIPIKDIKDVYDRIKELKDNIATLFESKDVLNKYEFFQKTLLVEINEREIKLNEEKSKNENEFLSIKNQIEMLERGLINMDSNKINKELSEIRIKLLDLGKEKDQATLRLSLSEKAKDAIKEASMSLVELQVAFKKGKEELESLELLKEALSPRGIKAVIIDYIVPQLEEKINGVLSQMSDFRIRLDTQKATVDEEGLKEGLFITVLNDLQDELPFDSYSGGEKVKITVAISEALASLMNTIGFRIMDENIVSLDKESTEGFVLILTKLQKEFPQLLIISHLQEVKDIFEKQIRIVKTDGISKII